MKNSNNQLGRRFEKKKNIMKHLGYLREHKNKIKKKRKKPRMKWRDSYYYVKLSVKFTTVFIVRIRVG